MSNLKIQVCSGLSYIILGSVYKSKLNCTGYYDRNKRIDSIQY